MLARKDRRKHRQYHVDAGHLALDTAAMRSPRWLEALSVLDVESVHVLTRKVAVYAI